MQPLEIRTQLEAMAEPNYRQFLSKLVPNVSNIIGIRSPQLRKLAKTLAKSEEACDYIQFSKTVYFEETMLQGMMIGYVKKDFQELLPLVESFIPKINNWCVCDSFCGSLKITKKHKEEIWEFLQPYFHSTEPYYIRFAVVMGLSYYVDNPYLQQLFEHFDRIQHDDYYVKMAVAWAISICFIHYPKQTENYLLNNTLDVFTHNKAIQKITESTRIGTETKQYLKKLKRKA